MSTTAADRLLLLDLARDAIRANVSSLPAPGRDLAGIFARCGAAFVSLHAQGALRGCVGHLDAADPLGRVVPQCAVAASSRDPRFPPVVEAEVGALVIELSLLGPLQTIAGASDVEVGRHGLIVDDGRRRGLLLPQVAREWRWDAETFLSRTCQKAGLPGDAWKRGAQLWRFEAEVFGESG